MSIRKAMKSIFAALVLFAGVTVIGWYATPGSMRYAIAQTIELSCPAGSQVAQAWVTTDPSTGDLRQNLCINTNGSLLFNGSNTLTAGSAVFNGSTSGTTTLQANATAGSGTVTLPTATGTLAETSQLGIGQNCGSTTTCAATALTAPLKFVSGTVTLSTGTATVTGVSPAFTSSTSAICTASDTTTATDGAKAVLASASSVTVTGNSSDVINYVCFGN